VVVVGATPAGIAAAVHAAQGGFNVALVEATGHIGGATSGGLSPSDFRTYESLGGAWLDFMRRVERHYATTYGRDSQQVRDCWRGAYYEPRVARRAFEQMLAEQQVRVLTHHRLQTTTLAPSAGQRRRIVRARFLTGGDRAVELGARIFIDATYEGDLMAAAGAPHRQGSEARAEYNEPLAPLEANRHLMACNFRIPLTREPANRLPLSRPPDYDPRRYRKAVELIQSGQVRRREFGGAGWVLDDFIRARPLPNGKADFNDRMGSPVSVKLVTECSEWPAANPVGPAGRARIYAKAKKQALGLFWFLAHDPALPDWVHAAMREWGLPKDEYPNNQHWTPQLYIREGRRMLGESVFTQHDCEPRPGSVRTRLQPDSVAIGDYSINSHGTHYGADGRLLGVLSHPVRPWQVPYGVIVPRTVDGLLAPVAVSASHVGYCAIRMEPTWTALGQAAGIAAALSLRHGVEARAVNVPELQRRLHARGAKTIYISDVEADSPYFRAAQYFGLRGFLHDLIDPRTATDWSRKPLSPVNQWTEAFPRAGCAWRARRRARNCRRMAD
jgi:FAD dependent oxidoreductase